MDDKQERDSAPKVREDLTKRIEELESLVSNSDTLQLALQLNQLTKAIVESAHIMGWPKDLLEAHGIRAFDKATDKMSVKQ